MKKGALFVLLSLLAILSRAQDEKHPKDITESGKVFLDARHGDELRDGRRSVPRIPLSQILLPARFVDGEH